MTCAGFYIYRGRRYENNDIFLLNACVEAQPSQRTQGLCITINSTGLAAAWADTVT